MCFLGVAEVTYAVSYLEASPADISLLPSSGVVVFGPGQTQASIVVIVVDDDEPEEQETFGLSLISVRGDAVLVSPDQATLVIEFSDDPNGVFTFAEDSLLKEAQEGENALFT
jgi:hypothetical protein